MKNWLWALLIIAIGVALGTAIAVSQLDLTSEVPTPMAGSPRTAPPPEVEHPETGDQTPPKIVVDQKAYDFGTMDSQAKGTHDFIIRNTGGRPLEIENKGTSCKCAVSDFKARTIAPGKSTTITLTWHAKGYFGPFEQTARISTNDPKEPKVVLKVHGRVTTPLRASPPEVVLSQVAAGQNARTFVQVYAYQADEFELTDVALQDADTAKFFEITPKRLSAEQVAQEKDARSGYELEILVKPGLPLDRFKQTILVQSNLPKAPKLEVPIKGKVVSDISVMGRDWDPDRRALRLGILARGEGADRTLFLVVRGRHRRTIDFELAEVFPSELLEVELGEVPNSTSGLTVRVPVKIHIGKQHGPANYLGAKESPCGRIIIDTNHPQVPQVVIPVRFAIEGG